MIYAPPLIFAQNHNDRNPLSQKQKGQVILYRRDAQLVRLINYNVTDYG